MDQSARFHETLRRLAIIDEGLAERQAGLGLGPGGISALDPKTVALLRLAVSVATGSSAACLEWGTTRALAAGATDDEITGVLLAIAPVAGLGRVTGAVPHVAAALGYDIDTALLELDDPVIAPYQAGARRQPASGRPQTGGKLLGPRR